MSSIILSLRNAIHDIKIKKHSLSLHNFFAWREYVP